MPGIARCLISHVAHCQILPRLMRLCIELRVEASSSTMERRGPPTATSFDIHRREHTPSPGAASHTPWTSSRSLKFRPMIEIFCIGMPAPSNRRTASSASIPRTLRKLIGRPAARPLPPCRSPHRVCGHRLGSHSDELIGPPGAKLLGPVCPGTEPWTR
jgi:hypothetical protein